jgi:hypothetical protein
MRFLGVVLVALVAFLAGLCAVARLYGQTQRPSAAVQAFSFDHCGDDICFKGIIPGQTSEDEALALLSQFSGAKVSRLPIGVPIGGDGLANVFIKVLLTRPSESGDPGFFPDIQPVSVGPILITRRNGKALYSVGWIVAQYGAPCRITVNATGYDFVLRYPALIVQVRLPLYSERRLSPDAPATSMMLNEAAGSDQCADTDPPWIGFASVERYLGSGQ